MCAVAFAGIVGCRALPPSRGERERVEPPAEATPQAERAEFAIAASMLDTWNAVGQVLVRLDGVTTKAARRCSASTWCATAVNGSW